MKQHYIVYAAFGIIIALLCIVVWELRDIPQTNNDNMRAASTEAVETTEKSGQSNTKDLVVRLLMRDEGKRSKPYKDARGNITIGVGRNLTGQGLSDDEIRYLLKNDVKRAESVARRVFGEMWDSIGKARQASIVDVIFNVGEAGFRLFVRFIAAVKEKDWTEAAKELLDSIAAHQNASRYHHNASVILTGNERYFEL